MLFVVRDCAFCSLLCMCGVVLFSVSVSFVVLCCSLCVLCVMLCCVVFGYAMGADLADLTKEVKVGNKIVWRGNAKTGNTHKRRTEKNRKEKKSTGATNNEQRTTNRKAYNNKTRRMDGTNAAHLDTNTQKETYKLHSRFASRALL